MPTRLPCSVSFCNRAMPGAGCQVKHALASRLRWPFYVATWNLLEHMKDANNP